ncbi:MAG: hypothetical protein AB8B53_11040 [Flavobacteriales bacterium]
MKTLNPYWFSEGLLDVEYKRYILLAYLLEVEKEYKQSKIFPALQNLAQNMTSMKEFKEKCDELSNAFPKTLKGINPESLSLSFTPNIHDPELLSVMYEIIDFSLPKIEQKVQEGKEIYDTVEQYIEIEPLGIIPIYKDEGYLFIQNDSDPTTDIYTYKVSFLEQGKLGRVLQTEFLKNTTRSLSNTYYSIKSRLIKEFKNLPNPATYIISSRLTLPKEATLLPVAKRMFIRTLSSER